MRISAHALERWRERTGDRTSDDHAVRVTMRLALASAKQVTPPGNAYDGTTYWRALRLYGHVVFVVRDEDAVVTVLPPDIHEHQSRKKQAIQSRRLPRRVETELRRAKNGGREVGL